MARTAMFWRKHKRPLAHFHETPYRGDGDLVFAHPHTRASRSPLEARQALQAAQGVPMRALQEMLGHRDFKTTLIYAGYAPSAREAEWVEAAFAMPAVLDGAVPAARVVGD